MNKNVPFEKSFAIHEKSKYWSTLNEFTPDKVFMWSKNKYWFICNKCNHNFDIRLESINVGQWCPYCCIPSKILCQDINCKSCYEKSFASHEKSQYWSNKNEITPRHVFKNSNTKYWFNCNICNHDFNVQLYCINKGTWCGYCSNKILCKADNCKICFEKSFASNEKSKYWSNKNELNPIQVVKNSHKKYLFNCNKCNHEFEIMLNHVNIGKWCGYCCNSAPKLLCNDNECKSCYEKSFASNEKSQYWSNKNSVTPRQVFKKSSSKYLFICENNHDFEMQLSNISNGKWCNKCVNKTETKFLDFIKPLYPSVISQFKQQWCKNIKELPFDFCIPEYKIIIEIDGLQHFKQISNWRTPDEQHNIDIYKQKCANENNYSIIRILQIDIYHDKYDWKNEIIKNINDIKIQNKIQNIYMCKNNEYLSYL